MLVGLLISLRRSLLPIADLRATCPTAPTSRDVVSTMFGTEVRFIGAGAIAVAAIWTLLKILGPIVGGHPGRGGRRAAARRGGGTVDLTERDLPIGIVGGTIAVSLIPIAAAAVGLPAGTTARRRERRRRLIAGQPGLRAGDRRRDRRPSAATWPASSARRTARSPGVGILVVLGIALLLVALLGPAPARSRPPALVAYRAVRHGDRLRRRHHLQRQPAGPQDRPAGRRDAVAAAGRADRRRDLRRAGDPAGARPAEHRLRLRRGARAPGPNALAAPQAALISALAQGRARRRPRTGT